MVQKSNVTVTQLSALAQETRLEVFRLLAPKGSEGMPAGHIAQTLDVAPNTLSSHLGVLQRAGLISQRREGRNIIYFILHDSVRGLVETLVDDCCLGEDDDCLPGQVESSEPLQDCA